jgi:hypothetical protein
LILKLKGLRKCDFEWRNCGNPILKVRNRSSLNLFFSPHFRKSIQFSAILRKCGLKFRMPAIVHYAPCRRIQTPCALRFHLKPSLWEELNVNYSYILTSPLALGTVNNITSVSHPFQFDIDDTLIFFLQIYIECYLVVAS